MTIVEWLVNQLASIDIGSGMKMKIPIPKNLIDEAKQMEKDRLNVARLDGISLADKGHGKQNKEEQKKLLIEIMEEDQKDGLYKSSTAVEWIHGKTCQLINRRIKNEISASELMTMHHNLYYEAKQIEKEQCKRDYYAGLEGYKVKEIGFEQYYNKTYGTE